MAEQTGRVRLDLNNPVFQRNLFDLTKEDQRSVLVTLKKLSDMSWNPRHRLHCATCGRTASQAYTSAPA